VGIGADDNLTININGTQVFSFYGNSCQAPCFCPYSDPADNGLIITNYVHAGSNKWVADAWDNWPNDDAGVVPLRITLPTNLKFLVTFFPDTIKNNDTSKIVVIAVDANNHEVVIPDSTHLTFTIIQIEPRWGWFIDATGNFAWSPLQDATYGDARAGKIKLWSSDYSDSLLNGVRRVRVRVEGGFRTGAGNIYMGTATLKFDGLDTVELYPNYPKNNNSTDKCDTLNLTLKSRFGLSNLAAPNVLVKMAPPTLIDSGGHSHDGKRPRGKFQTKNANSWDTVDSLQQATDVTGVLNFKFVASQFGGLELVKAMRVFPDWSPNPETHAFKKTKTRVPGLLAIHSGFNHFITYTSTEQYHKLSNSDYGTVTTRTAVDSAVARYARALGLKDTSYLGVDDMSLPLGGGFDVLGKWENSFKADSGGHSWHRQGRSIDFSHYYFNAQGQSRTASISRDGTVRKNSSRIEDDELDKQFKKLNFSREEKTKKLIHYEALPKPVN
jgi:hypothetical protein